MPKPSMFDGGKALQFQKTPFIRSDNLAIRSHAAKATAYLRQKLDRSTHICTKNAGKAYWHIPESVDALIQEWEDRGRSQKLAFYVVYQDGSTEQAHIISGQEWLSKRQHLERSRYGGWLWK